MTKVKVGDLVKGNAKSDERYCVTNSKMTKAKVTSIDGNYITVKILEHADSCFIGHIFDELDPDYFELVESFPFKVGDKVKIRQWDDMANEFGYEDDDEDMIDCRFGFTDLMKKYCGKTATITVIDHDNEVQLVFDDKNVTPEFYNFSTDMIELIIPEYVIYNVGRKTLAKDTTTGKPAIAKCNPEDEFDFMVGAKLAFERLTTISSPESYSGKVVCIDDGGLRGFTCFKIYEFKNGQFINDENIQYPLNGKIKDFDDLTEYFKGMGDRTGKREWYSSFHTKKFAEVVE